MSALMRMRAQAHCKSALPCSARIAPLRANHPAPCRPAHASVLPSYFHGTPIAHTCHAQVSRRSAAGRSFRLDVRAAAKKSVGDLQKQDLEGKTVFVSPFRSPSAAT